MTTNAILQLNINDITNAVNVSAIFCTIVDRRSANALRTSVASAANFDKSDPVEFSSKSNQPISLLSIAEKNKKINRLRFFNDISMQILQI